MPRSKNHQLYAAKAGFASWDAWVADVEKRLGRKICAALAKRKREPCPGPPMPNGRCYMHGGVSLPGFSATNFKDGKTSRYPLKGAMAEPYRRHLADLDYIALRDELAVITTQIEETALLLEGMRQKRKVLPMNEDQRASAILEDEKATALLRKRLRTHIEQRRRLASTEAKRIKMAQDTLTGEHIRTFAAAVLQAVREEVRDNHQVRAIQNRVMGMLRSAQALPPEEKLTHVAVERKR